MSTRSPRKRPPRADVPHRRDQELLEAAASVFYERGYSDATVQEVARELGILKGSLYHYIDTKEDLLFAVVEQVHVDAEALLAQVIAAALDDPTERLELYVRRSVEYNLRNIRRISVYHREFGRLTGERRERSLLRRAAHEQFVSQLILEAQQGRAPEAQINPRVLANLVFGAIVWAHTWFRPDTTVDPARIVDTCCRFVLSGLSRRAPTEPRRAA